MDADRDRGTPRGAAPPTPPGIRVRTTAVRPGKQSGPLKMRQSERGEVRAGKRPAERGSASGAPRPAVAASREDGVLRIHAAFPQLAETRTGSLPLLPDGGVEAPPNPRATASENRRCLAVAEVRPPAQQVRRQLPHHLVQTDAADPSGQHPDPLPESEHRRGGQAPLRSGTAREAEAQERQRPCWHHRALRRVDLELEPSRDEGRQTCHHTLARPNAADIHVAVSRPGESHPRALAELYVNVSAHTAPIIQPPASPPADANGRTAGARDEQGHRANGWLDGDVAVASCISAWPIEPTGH